MSKPRNQAANRRGLLGGASRKQYDAFRTKTGDAVAFQERRLTNAYSTQQNLAGTYVLRTIPITSKGKLIFFQHTSESQYSRLRINTTDVTYLLNGTLTQSFPYENGIELPAGSTVNLVLDGADVAFLSVIIVEEDASGSYLSEI